MDFGNFLLPDPHQQAMINAIIQQIETLKQNGNDDVLALITAKLSQEAAASSSSAGSSAFSTILPSPSSSISSPSTSSLMSQLPTPLGVYSSQPSSMTNISSLYHHHPSASSSAIITNPLSPPSIIPSPSSVFCIPTTPSSVMMSGAPTPIPHVLGGPSYLQQPQPTEIQKLLQSFSLSNILQNVQTYGNLPINFLPAANSSNSMMPTSSLPPFQPSHHQLQQQLSTQTSMPSSASQISTYLSSPPQLQLQQQQQQPPQIYSQPSTSACSLQTANYLTDDESIADEQQPPHQQPPRSCTSSVGSGKIPGPGRKRKPKQPEFDDTGKPIVQRIRRRRRNGSIPEEDSAAKKLLAEKKSGTPSKKQQPPLPDNEQQQQHHHQQMVTPDDPIIHSPPSLRPNQIGSQVQGYMGYQTNDIQQNPIGAAPPSAASSVGPPQNYPSTESPTGSFQRSDSQSGDESSSRSRRSKTCRVCGDNATGYNFNVITCESCKAFFRRNANRLKGDFKCPYSDDCEINAVSRRFCQKCRLKKCFTVGMKREWILNDDQLKRRKNSRLNHGSMKTSARSSPSTKHSFKSPPPQTAAKHQQQHSSISPKIMSQQCSPQSQVGLGGRNASSTPARTDSVPPAIPRNDMGSVNQSFSVRSSIDITSPVSVNASTPVSLTMMSPVNSMSPSSSSMVSSSTPPQMSPKPAPEIPMKFFTLNEIIHAYHRHISPQSYPLQLQSPANAQTVKIVVQSGRLFNPQIAQFLGCGEYVRISLTVTDYAQLFAMCGKGNNISPSMELQNGDISLIEEAYDPLKKMIEEYATRAIHQQQQQISPTSSQYPGFPHPYEVTTPSPNNYHSGPLISAPMYDGYIPNCNEIRSTTILTSTVPQYDPLSAVKIGPQPEINPELMPQEFRQQWMNIDSAIDEEFHNEDKKPVYVEMRKIEKPKIILNIAELKELDSIRTAFVCMDEILSDNKAASYLDKTDHEPTDIMNIMDITIRRIVKTAKKLERFQEISNDGKLALLKSSMIDMLTIRGVVLLDEKMTSFSTPILGKEIKVSLDMFDSLTDPMQKERFKTFFTSIHPVLRKNHMAVMLVALVVLFDDTRATKLGEKDQTVVRHYHEMYYHLLQRYIESVYCDQAPEMINSVPYALQRLAKTSATSVNLFLGRVNAKDVAPLPTEFFRTELEPGMTAADAALAAVEASSREDAKPDVLISNSIMFSSYQRDSSTGNGGGGGCAIRIKEEI